MTNVVNVKVAYIRPEYNNLFEWCQCNNNVYIGRQGVVFVDNKRYPTESSIWANPFKINKNTTRDECIKQYEIYIRNKIKKENLVSELLKLKNKILGCWCKPEPCHGDILLKLIQEYECL